jgi:hypothetical protein
MAWKLHEISTEVLYNNLRYDRIRFLETTDGKADLGLYPDPGDKHAEIGIGFRLESNWNEILTALGFDVTPLPENFLNSVRVGSLPSPSRHLRLIF